MESRNLMLTIMIGGDTVTLTNLYRREPAQTEPGVEQVLVPVPEPAPTLPGKTEV